MTRFMIVALGIAVLGVGGAVWMAGNTPPPVVVQPDPLTTDLPVQYPLELWDSGVEGESVVMAHVTAAGAVDSAYVLQSSGEPAFDSAAIAGAMASRFSPGRHDDHAVAAWVRLPVRFRIPDLVNPPATGEPSDE